MYVSIALRPSLNACRVNPIIRPGDKHLGLPDTNIHGVTEQTCPDMPFLCKTTVFLTLPSPSRRIVSKFLSRAMRVNTGCLVLHTRYADSHSRSRPETITTTCSGAALPICTAAQNLRFRYLILSRPPEKRWSLTTKMYGVRPPVKSEGGKNSDILPCPYLQRSGGA